MHPRCTDDSDVARTTSRGGLGRMWLHSLSSVYASVSWAHSTHVLRTSRNTYSFTTQQSETRRTQNKVLLLQQQGKIDSFIVYSGWSTQKVWLGAKSQYNGNLMINIATGQFYEESSRKAGGELVTVDQGSSADVKSKNAPWERFQRSQGLKLQVW